MTQVRPSTVALSPKFSAERPFEDRPVTLLGATPIDRFLNEVSAIESALEKPTAIHIQTVERIGAC
ncbi:MAG TPA: hypothetical protein DER02_06390 [Gammaproteobacteria bacterium]|nr:hypothetical protein [Gammaproteobacteria bacterium]